MTTKVFAIFFALYSTELNADFLNQLSEIWEKDHGNFKGIVFFTVAIMGFATTIVLTLAFMQLFKAFNNRVKNNSNPSYFLLVH